MTIRNIVPSPDGRLPGIHVVGYHGQLGPRQTPARRLPVYADSEGFQVKILESDSISTNVKYLAKKIPDTVWNTTGTRINPSWSADSAATIMFIIGDRCLNAILESPSHSDSVKEFLLWAKSKSQYSDRIRSIRIGDLIAWNTSPESSDALCDHIVPIARREVFKAAQSGRNLESSSFWLSRAAIRDEDLFLAVAGLRRSGSEFWEDVLHAGIKYGTWEWKLTMTDEAERFFHESGKTDG